MNDTLEIYDCPECGEMLEDQVYFDGEDSLCLICGNVVKRRTIEADGKQVPVVKQVDHKRWMEARGAYCLENHLE